MKLRSYLIETREAERSAFERSNLSADGSEVIDFDKEVMGRTSE